MVMNPLVRELRTTLLDHPAPLLVLRGRPDAGQAHAVRAILEELPHLLFRANPLSDTENRADLWRRALDAWDTEVVGSEPPTWDALFEWIAERSRFGRRPFILAIEDTEYLIESNRTFLDQLGRSWGRIRGRGDPLRIVLTTRRMATGVDALLQDEDPDAISDVRLPTESYRALGTAFPGWSPRECMLLASTIGGFPDRIAMLNPARSLRENLRESLWNPSGRLHDLPLREIESEFRTPQRFVGILRALAHGALRWKEVLGSMPELHSSNQIAPYVRALEDHGLVESRRPLDASPQSRNRRYRLTDPLFSFWLRFVLPHRAELYDARTRAEVEERELWPAVERHAALWFERICTEFLEHHAQDALGANARQVGGIWSVQPEIPIAGILRNGTAVYASSHWDRQAVGPDPIRTLQVGMRRTRYAFTKERRFRLVFSASGFTHEAEREAARSTGVYLIGIEDLWGGKRQGE